MQNDMDWQGILSSEIFKEYSKLMDIQDKLTVSAQATEKLNHQTKSQEVLHAWNEFENSIKQDVLAKHLILKVQAAIKNNSPEIANIPMNVRAAFLMIDLEDDVL